MVRADPSAATYRESTWTDRHLQRPCLPQPHVEAAAPPLLLTRERMTQQAPVPDGSVSQVENEPAGAEAPGCSVGVAQRRRRTGVTTPASRFDSLLGCGRRRQRPSTNHSLSIIRRMPNNQVRLDCVGGRSPGRSAFASTRWRRSGRKVAGSERAPLWRILLCRAVVSRVDSGSSGDPRVRAALTVQGRRVRFRAFSLLRPSLFSGRVRSSSLPVGIRVLRGLRV